MDSTGLLRAVRRHARLLVIVLIAGLMLSAVVAALLPRTYTGRATLFLRVQSANTSLYQRSQFAMQRIQSYPQLLESRSVLDAVIARTRLHETPQQLASHLSAESTAGTILLTVSATAPSAQQAADVANAASAALASHVNDLENSQNTTKNAVLLVPQVTASVPSAPTTPNVPAVLGLGLIGGLVAGLLLALGLERFRPRLRDAADVRRVTGLPLVGRVPSADGSGDDGDARELADNLRILGRGRVAPVLLVLPVSAGADGIAVGQRLARGLAMTGRRVLTIATGGPSIEAPGLSELLAGTAPVDQIVRHSDDGLDVEVVTAGDPAVTPSSFDLETGFAAIVTPLVADHDVSLLQGSMHDGALDLAVVGPFARTALLVVSGRSSTERDVRRVLGALRALDVLPIGVVLSDGPRIDAADLAATWQDGDYLRIELDAPPRSERLRPPAGIARSDR